MASNITFPKCIECIHRDVCGKYEALREVEIYAPLHAVFTCDAFLLDDSCEMEQYGKCQLQGPCPHVGENDECLPDQVAPEEDIRGQSEPEEDPSAHYSCDGCINYAEDITDFLVLAACAESCLAAYGRRKSWRSREKLSQAIKETSSSSPDIVNPEKRGRTPKLKKCSVCGEEYMGHSASKFCPSCRPKVFSGQIVPKLKTVAPEPIPDSYPATSPGDYGRIQREKTQALLNEYGTADLSKIEQIKKERSEGNF